MINNNEEMELTFSNINPLVIATISDLKSLATRLEFLSEYDRSNPARYSNYLPMVKVIESEAKELITTLQRLTSAL